MPVSLLPRPVVLLPGLLLALVGCSLFPSELPVASVPLVDMEEPRHLFVEPDDESTRTTLALGTFTGLEVGDSRGTLSSMLTAPESIRVTSVVENSPAMAAGVEEDDLLFEGALDDGPFRPLRRPSDLRGLELEGRASGTLRLRLDRAGRELERTLTLEGRVRPRDRQPVERYREEQHLGFVVRTATEVEARRASLPPGAGAVVVGLASNSPLREAGVEYEDLITHVDGREVAHPQDLLAMVRELEAGDRITLRWVSADAVHLEEVPVSERERETRKIHLPLLFRYERNWDRSNTSFLLGLFAYESTPVAWEFSFLWFFEFSGGEADRLEEVER